MGLKSAGKWYTIHKNVDRERDRIELKRARKGARKRMGGWSIWFELFRVLATLKYH